MRTISIRTSLLRNSVALVLLMSTTFLVVTVFGTRRAIRELSARLIEQSAGQAEEQLDSFFGSIEDMLLASRSWWEAGLIDYTESDDVEDLNALFIPVLDAYLQVTSMHVVHGAGLEYMLFRDLRGGDAYEWYNRVVLADEGPDAGFEVLWTRELELYRRGPLPEEAWDYDPRKRPFYLDPPYDEMYWTGPYYFFTTKDAGMTACYKWQDEATGQTRLVAYDLLLMDLSRFTAELQPSENGKTFVMLDDGSLLSLPRDERWADDVSVREALRNPEERAGGVTQFDRSAQLMTARDFELPAVADAVDYWRGVRKDEVNLFRYKNAGEAWWGGFRPFTLGGQTLWIGVVVPEDDFLLDIRRLRDVVLGIAAAALLLGVLMAGLMARRFSRPLEMLAEQTARVRELQLTDHLPVRSRLTEVQQLADANAQMMKALDSFARYVPMDLVRELLRRGEVAKIGGSTETLSILFTDIEGFTSLAERMDPENLTAHMAEYFSSMLQVLSDEQATVDKFIGDAIVAFWGAPNPDRDHATHAVRAVLRAITMLEGMNAAWVEEGRPELRTRFGLNTGDAVVGNVGSPERLSYTVLGDTVNLASRLESLNRMYGTYALATKAVVVAAGEGFLWRHVDRVAVQGKTEGVDIYEPLGEAGNVPQEVIRVKEEYEAALALYIDGRFAAAAQRLDALASEQSGDRVIMRLFELARANESTPPSDWDGVTHYTEK